MPYSHRMQKSLIQSSFYAPRGRDRIYDLGMQLSQLYLSPYDKLIGFIGEAGSGKSALIKGMFPGLELTNDDDGVNVRPLPLLDAMEDSGFFSPHTYHVDIRFEMGLTQPHILAEAILGAISRGKRVIVEHFDLIYSQLGRNADLMIGVGEQILISRPNMFGPDPEEFAVAVHSSLPYRLMAHTAEDLCETHMSAEQLELCHHDDIHHGFMLVFYDRPPELDLVQLEQLVNEDIRKDLPVQYGDETHILIGSYRHKCSGPRTHVSRTGKVLGFRLCHDILYDRQQNRYLLIGFVGEDSEESVQKLYALHRSQPQSDSGWQPED